MKTALIALLVGVLAGGATYAVQQGQIDSLEEELASARADHANARVDSADQASELEKARQELKSLRRKLKTARAQATIPAGVEAGDATDLPDGEHLVNIEELTQHEDGTQIVVDVLQWFTGDAADTAAAEDGYIEEGEQVPNDHYIRNVNPLLRTLPIAAGAGITLTTCCNTDIPAENPVDIATLARIFNSPRAAERHVSLSPFWLTIEDGAVALIEEQYLP